MRNISILAGAAALALAGPALAQGKGNGGGGQKGGGGDKPAKVERGGGGGGSGGGRMERGGGQRMERQQVRGAERREVRVERRAERAQPRAEQRRPVREVRAEQSRGGGRERQAEVREQRGNRDRKVVREVRDVRRQDRSADVRTVRTDFDRSLLTSPAFRSTGLINGCPPGLAAKNNGCLPPGQAKRLVGTIAPAALGGALLPSLYRSWYPDDEEYFYRTDNGYVYRIDRDRNFVDAFFPLVDDYNGAYYVGAAYPQDYLGYYNVPVQYQPWYADGGNDYYRYGDGAIYRVDRGGGLIEAVVSLLAGDLALGQPLPAGYDVYNVPYDYRDRYADGPDAWYRYNDGYIYQVDPTTRLVQAIVETLV